MTLLIFMMILCNVAEAVPIWRHQWTQPIAGGDDLALTTEGVVVCKGLTFSSALLSNWRGYSNRKPRTFTKTTR